MELWLLVGAVVLVALTVWIVWPAQRSEEVTGMTDSRSNQPNLPPQGAAFEDQYTSATADLSAGGVATAREVGAPVTLNAAMPETAAGSEPWASPSVAREGIDEALMPVGGSGQPRAMVLTQPRTLGIGAASMIMVGSGVGGAWLYRRWQRERARPINRFRRRAEQLTSRLPEVVDELPEQTMPVSGAAAALLVSSVMAVRAMRRSTTDARAIVADQVEQVREAQRRRNLPIPARKQTILGGLGLGGTAIVVGGAWLIWRLLRGDDHPPRHLYITDRMGE